jgi:hypothetical protein
MGASVTAASPTTTDPEEPVAPPHTPLRRIRYATVRAHARHPVEAQLILKEVSEEPGKTPGGERLAPGIIDPGAVMRVEPAVLMLIGIRLVHLVRAPDIDGRQGLPLGIRARIEEERLVGPLGAWVGVDQALCPRCLEAGDQGGRLLEQRLHLGIREGQDPVEGSGDFWRELPTPGARMPREDEDFVSGWRNAETRGMIVMGRAAGLPLVPLLPGLQTAVRDRCSQGSGAGCKLCIH